MSDRIMENGIDKRCREMSYRLWVKTEDFDADGFAKALTKISQSEDWQTITLGPRSKNSLGFHAHVFWRRGRGKPSEIQLQVDFHKWKTEKKPLPDMYAEELYPWVAQFLKPQIANIHVHAEYEFPLKQWRPTVMPLPLKVPFGGKSAVVDGVSLELSDEPSGVHGAWLRLKEKQMTVQLYAFRQIEFSTFKMENDIQAFTSVIKNIAEEKL